MANPTPDSQMNYYLAQIAEAKKGKDVRSAIYGGLERTFNKSYEWTDTANANANDAQSKSSQALDVVSTLSSDIDQVHQEAQEMTQEYEEISGRVDNIIAHNQDTTSNTELIDIRACYNGYVAGTAGTAVRKQVKDLHTQIDNVVLNNPRSSVAVNQPASVTYTEIWSNSSPSSNFAGQTINFTAVDDTMEYLIEYRKTASDPTIYSCIAAGSRLTPINAIVNSTYGIANAERLFTFGNGTITVTDAQAITPNNPFSLSGTDMTIVNPSASVGNANNYIVPVKIYAVQHAITGTFQISKDTEIVDARTGADGVVYQTLGEAIRSQISEYIASGVLDALTDSY